MLIKVEDVRYDEGVDLFLAAEICKLVRVPGSCPGVSLEHGMSKVKCPEQLTDEILWVHIWLPSALDTRL